MRDIGERESGFMKRRIKYTDEPIGDVKVVADFLPSPAELAFREETVKVTIALSKASVNYFKQASHLHKVPYQKMIRRLLDDYSLQHSRAVSK